MTPNLHLWLIPLLLLTGAAINGFFGKRFSRQAVSAIALGFSGARLCRGIVGSCASNLPVAARIS